MTVRKPFAAVAAFALFFFAGCKLNKDGNCLNPKAGCFVKDTEAPRVTVTDPPSTETTPGAPNQPSLSQIVITFSEPMKNAGDKSNYSVTPIAATIGSIDKLSDTSYRVNFSNPPTGIAQAVLNIAPLTDLSGNAITVPTSTITVPLAPIQATHTFVSNQAGSFQSTDLTWKNGNLVAVDYTVKRGGTNCATATALSGTNVSGTGLAANAEVVTTLDRLQFTDQVATKVWVCQVNAGAGVNVELEITITRDDTSPAVGTITAGIYPRPHTITLTCSDNAERIAYRTDGIAPTYTVARVEVNPAVQYVTATGYALPMGEINLIYSCVDRAGNISAASAVYNLKSAMVWGTSLWSVPGPTPPYDVWK